MAYQRLGDFGRAMADPHKAIELQPDYAVVYNNRGFAYYELDDFPRAIADYEKALSVASDPVQIAEIKLDIELLKAR